jgi:ABC-type transporter MlaC component
MKRKACLAFVCFAFLEAASAAEPANTPEQEIAAMVKQLQAQQALIAENQAKIEAKLATIDEAVRIARIYASRGGK